LPPVNLDGEDKEDYDELGPDCSEVVVTPFYVIEASELVEDEPAGEVRAEDDPLDEGYEPETFAACC
jgi:hypothetical protein